jgi:hypothetical protein
MTELHDITAEWAYFSLASYILKLCVAGEGGQQLRRGVGAQQESGQTSRCRGESTL